MKRFFKQTAMKYVDYSIKLSPYRHFCCPLSLISALSSANIPVSPRFFGEFDPDMLTLSARHFEKLLIPSSTQPTRNPPKAALKPNGYAIFSRLWLQARKNIARRTSIYGRSSCNGLRVTIQIRFCRGDWKELFVLTS